jgi:hypothetical protein
MHESVATTPPAMQRWYARARASCGLAVVYGKAGANELCNSTYSAKPQSAYALQCKNAVEDEEVVQEEDLSDEEADSAGPVKWVVPAWEVLAHDRTGW